MQVRPQKIFIRSMLQICFVWQKMTTLMWHLTNDLYMSKPLYTLPGISILLRRCAKYKQKWIIRIITWEENPSTSSTSVFHKNIPFTISSLDTLQNSATRVCLAWDPPSHLIIRQSPQITYPAAENVRDCNCRKKEQCLLEGQCLAKNIICKIKD